MNNPRNQATMIGTITKQGIELRSTPNGTSVATFSIAVRRNYKNQEGKYDYDFIPVVTWKHQAEFCAKYLKAKDLVVVTGSIRPRSYDDKDGNKRTITELQADTVQSIGNRQQTDTGASDSPTEVQTPDGLIEVSESLPF